MSAPTSSPRIVALLSWWDERPDWLAECVASVAPFASHVVAVDGAYAAFPGGTARSDPEQAQAIMATCDAHGIGCTVYAPQTTWHGGEVEKRSATLALAEQSARPNSWLFVIDADELVKDVPTDFQSRLSHTMHDVCESTLWMPAIPHGQDRVWTCRRLFRTGLGLRVVGIHSNYVTADGRRLLAGRAADFGDLVIEHRDEARSDERTTAKSHYYNHVQPQIEALPQLSQTYHFNDGDDLRASHIKAKAHGGTDDTDNGTTRCAKHDRMTDPKARWTLEVDGGGFS